MGRGRNCTLALMIAIVLTIGWMPFAEARGTQQDAGDAAATARELSRLEANRDFNGLYDRIHPDARAIVPVQRLLVGMKRPTPPRALGRQRLPAFGSFRGHGQSTV